MDTDPLTDPAAPDDQASETGPGQPAAEGDHASESAAAPSEQPHDGAAPMPAGDLPADEAALLGDGDQANPYTEGVDVPAQEDYR